MLRDWLERGREERARAEAIRAELLAEYREKVRAGDPDMLEVSRDYADNNGGSWNVEVGFAAGILIFMVSVLVLVVLFSGIAHLVGR